MDVLVWRIAKKLAVNNIFWWQISWCKVLFLPTRAISILCNHPSIKGVLSYSVKQWKLMVSRENVLLDSPRELAPQKLHQSSNWSNSLMHKSTTWIQMHVGRIDVELSTDVISYLLWFPPSWLLVLFWPLFSTPSEGQGSAGQAFAIQLPLSHISHYNLSSLSVSQQMLVILIVKDTSVETQHPVTRLIFW